MHPGRLCAARSLPPPVPRCAQMNRFCVIDRREGTVAGCGPSNLAAGTDDEVGIGKRGGHGARSGLGCWVITAAALGAATRGVAAAHDPRQRVTEKEGCDGGS
jgi:hypothetical protein